MEAVKPMPKELAVLSDAMARELPASKLPNGATGFMLKNVPLLNGKTPTAVILTKNLRSVHTAISRNAKTMYFALGLANPGKGVQAHCRIAREDGTVVELKWLAGKNIAPSLGNWAGNLSGDQKGAKLKLAGSPKTARRGSS